MTHLDSDKTVYQLLSDMNDLTIHVSNDNPAGNVHTALTVLGKHASIMIKISVANKKDADKIHAMTQAMLILTGVIAVLTIIMLCRM